MMATGADPFDDGHIQRLCEECIWLQQLRSATQNTVTIVPHLLIPRRELFCPMNV